MPLVPLLLARALQPALVPVRWLAARQWLREADVDFFLGALQPAWALRRIYARVESRRWVAEDMLALRLRPNGNWPGAFPGQHVQVLVEQGGVRLSRSYSLTEQADGCLEIAVRRQPEGRVSSWLCESLAVGDCLELSAPYGELRWPASGAVLLAAAGSGLTPLLGLLRAALASGFAAPVHLLHYVSRHEQRAFVEELLALQVRHANFSVAWAVTQGATESGLNQRFSPEHVAPWRAAHLLSCGPGGFVDTVAAALRDSAASVQQESFTPPRWLPPTERRELRLGFSLSRREVAGDNQRSLLEQAEAQGLAPEYGCRQGICTRCTCQLLEGAVQDLRSGEISHEPGQSIRLCVSAPLGNVRVNL